MAVDSPPLVNRQQVHFSAARVDALVGDRQALAIRGYHAPGGCQDAIGMFQDCLGRVSVDLLERDHVGLCRSRDGVILAVVVGWCSTTVDLPAASTVLIVTFIPAASAS